MTTTPYTTHATILGKRLWALAVSWSRNGQPQTQAAREAAIKAVRGRKALINGSRSIRAARMAVEAAAEAITAARRQRQLARRRPYRPDGVVRGRRPVVFTDTLAERLEAYRLSSFQTSLRQAGLRTDDVPDAILTTDPQLVGVGQSDHLDWDFYAKSCKYPKKVVSTTFIIPTCWISRVKNQGLALVGGLLTLDAQRLEGAPEGIAIYAATWVEQGRGYDIRVTQGFIALGLGESYHGATAKQAMSGLRRKMGLKKVDADLANLLAKRGLDEVAASHPELTVTVSDARATGSCEYGIRSWCARNSLPYDAGKAPLGRVYEAYRADPLAEARAAILHALRRQRGAVTA